MKKHNGFTLIELIIGMAVTVLILGGIVAVVRGGFGSMLTGQSQATAYANARAVMEDITTTLRYASDVNLGTGTISYSGPKDGVTVDNYSDTKKFSREITWEGSGDSIRLKIVKDGDTNNPVYFPASSSNSAFTSDDYVTAYGKMGGTASDRFPIFEDAGEDVYDIVLPVKYAMSGTNASKVDILRSKISASKIVNNTEGTIAGEKDEKQKKAESIGNILAIAVTNLYNNNPTALRTNSGKGNFTSNISSIGLHNKNIETKIAGISAALWDTISDGDQKIIGDTSWVIVPCNRADNIISSSVSTVDHWKVFIARNVVDDVPDPNKGYLRIYDTDTGSNTNKTTDHGALTLKAKAENEQLYILRPDYGLITYCFTTMNAETVNNKQVQVSTLVTTDTDITYGFSTGYHYNKGGLDLIYINYGKWVPALVKNSSPKNYTNYKTLQDQNNYYIEDYSTSDNRNTKCRIDYDGAGVEYISTYHPSTATYVYPPNMNSDKTNW